MSSSKVIVLKSSDGETFEVEEAVALQSQVIKDMIEANCAVTSIPLPNVTSRILAKVIEYCKKHVEAPKSSDGDKSSDEDLKSFDANFVKVDLSTFFDLVLAANYLNIRSLLDLTYRTLKDMIKGKTPEEICKTFNIKNDFEVEEDERRLQLRLFQRLRLCWRRVEEDVEEDEKERWRWLWQRQREEDEKELRLWLLQREEDEKELRLRQQQREEEEDEDELDKELDRQLRLLQRGEEEEDLRKHICS